MSSLMAKWQPTTLKDSLRRSVEKVTSSKLIMFYLAFSLLYCVVQTALSARAFLDSDGPQQTLDIMLELGNARNVSIPLFKDDQLALCATSPEASNYQCSVVWDRTTRENSISAPIKARGAPFNVTPGVRNSTRLQMGNVVMDLDRSCLYSLNYALFELGHSKRENVAFLTFQIWVFIISLIGVLAGSIPHVLAALAVHGFVLVWGIFQITQSISFEAAYKKIITNGACSGAAILPDLFDIRRRTDLPLLIINFVAFIFACFLTFRVIKLVNWRVFKTVGANLAVNRHRKIMLLLFISIQLSFFFITVFAGLIFDNLIKGNLLHFASFPIFYKACSISTIILILPWMLTGIYAVEKEAKLPMFFFLGYALIWIIGFASMFFSSAFIQEFTNWPFFAAVGIISVVLTAGSFILGLLCRFNFGKGYLVAKDVQAQSPVDTRAKTWVDLESSPHGEKAPEMFGFPNASIPQLPDAPLPPLRAASSKKVPRFLTPETSAVMVPYRIGLTDSGAARPPKYRDSLESFGNMGSDEWSPPANQARTSNRPRQLEADVSHPVAAQPMPLWTVPNQAHSHYGRKSEAVSIGQLDGMFATRTNTYTSEVSSHAHGLR